MKQTVQERAKELCEAWGMEDSHGCSVKDTFQAGFVQGANWQAEQSMSQEQIDMKIVEHIKSIEIDDKLKLGQYILCAISGMAIDINSAKTTLSTEFTHKGKRYKAEMLITQKEV